MKKRFISVLLSMGLLLSLIPFSAVPGRAASSGTIRIDSATPALYPSANKEADLVNSGFHWEAGTLTLRNLTVTGSILLAQPNVTLELEGRNIVNYGADGGSGIGSSARGTLTILGTGSLTLTAAAANCGWGITQFDGSIVIDGCAVTINHRLANSTAPNALEIVDANPDVKSWSSLSAVNGADLRIDGGNLVIPGRIRVDGVATNVNVVGTERGIFVTAVGCGLLEINGGSLRADGVYNGGNCTRGLWTTDNYAGDVGFCLRMNGGTLYTAGRAQGGNLFGDVYIGNGARTTFYGSYEDGVVITRLFDGPANLYFDGDYYLFAATGNNIFNTGNAFRILGQVYDWNGGSPKPYAWEDSGQTIKGSASSLVVVDMNILEKITFSPGIFGTDLYKGWAMGNGNYLKRLNIVPALKASPCVVPDSNVDEPIAPIHFAAGVSGGLAPYTYTLIGPDWLEFDASGSVTGTPGSLYGTPTTPAEPCRAMITVADSDYGSAVFGGPRNSVIAEIDVGRVNGDPLKFEDKGYAVPGSTIFVPIGPVDVLPGVSGGTKPYIFSITAGPDWLTIDPKTGVITGTPTAAAVATTVTITVTDCAKEPDSASITIPVGAVAGIPLAFANTYSIPESDVDTAITALNVYGGVSGGTAPYSFSITAGPAWLQINPSTGVITGTPTLADAATSATITVTDSASPFDTKSITIPVGAVTGVPLVFVNNGFDIPGSAVDAPIVPVDVTGGVTGGRAPYAFSMSGPAWLDIDPITGIITGTPVEASAGASATITVMDSAGASESITITVGAVAGLPEPLQFVNLGWSIPSTVVDNAITPINVTPGVSGGTAPYTFSIASAAGWLDIGPATGIITGTPTEPDYNRTAVVTVTDDAGASQSIVIVVGDVTKLTMTAINIEIDGGQRGSNLGNGYYFSVSGGAAPYTFDIIGPNWLKFEATDATTIHLFGTFPGPRPPSTAVVMCTDSLGNTVAITIYIGAVTGNNPGGNSYPLKIDPASPLVIPPDITGVPIDPINIDSVTDGGIYPYTYSIATNDGSTWLKIDPVTGIVTGLRTTAAGATFATVTVTDSASPSNTATATITVGAVTGAPWPLAFTKSPDFDIPAGMADMAIAPVDVYGGVTGGTQPYSFALGGPVWLSIDEASGVITGTPTTAVAATTAYIVVTDSASPPESRSIVIDIGAVAVNPSPLVFTKPAGFSIPAGAVNTSFGPVDMSGWVSGGTGPYTFDRTTGPAWLNVSAGGMITGPRPPAAAGAASATITVYDSMGASKSVTISIGAVTTVAATPLTFINDGFDIPPGTAGTAITPVDVTGGVSGGTGPYTFTTSAGPAWLDLIPGTGTLAGMPTGAAAMTFIIVTVTDSIGASKSIIVYVGAMTASAAQLLSFVNNGFDIPAGVVGTAITLMDVSGGVSGGIEDYTFSMVGPAWLSIDPGTGVITGQPTASSAAISVTITVTDSAAPPASRSITITVGPVATNIAPLTFNNLGYDIPPGMVGKAINPVLAAPGVSGGVTPYTFSIVGPTWLSIVATGVNAGRITGTPQNADSARTAVIIVTDSAGQTASASITITVGAVTVPLPLTFTNKGFDIPASVTGVAIVNMDVTSGVLDGAAPYTFSKTDGPAWLNFLPGTGILAGTPTGAANPTTATIRVTDSAGAWREIIIAVEAVAPAPLVFTNNGFNIPASGAGTAITPVNVTSGVTGGTAPYTFSIAGPAWLSVTATGTGAGVISGMPLDNAATATATVTVTDAAGLTESITITVGAVSGISILRFTVASYDIPARVINEAIAPLNAAGDVTGGTGPYTFDKTAGPAWLNVSAGGLVTGAPTAPAAATTATIKVTDSASRTADVTVYVGAVKTPLSFTKLAGYDIPAGTRDIAIKPVSVYDSVDGGFEPYTFSITGPAWLSIDPGTGVIAGTPKTASPAAATATITVTDSAGTPVSKSITITVGAVTMPLTLINALGVSIPPSTQGMPITPVYAGDFANGGVLPYTFSITSGPAWLSINPATGVITGTPMSLAPSATTIVITVTDSASPPVSRNLTLSVGRVDPPSVPQPLVFYNYGFDIPASTVGTAIAPMNVSGGAGGGTAPYTFSMAGPAWLSITAAGVITGTPTAVWAQTQATITVRDSAGATKGITISIGAVAAPPAPLPLSYLKLTGFDIPGSEAGTGIAPVDVSGGAYGGTAPYTFSIAGPAWLSIDPATGVITGAPTSATGAATAAVTVTDKAGASTTITISVGTVAPAPPPISAAAPTGAGIPGGTDGAAIAPVDASGWVSGGYAPYTYSIAGPAWLSIDPVTGIITGTPTGPSPATTATITVTDARGNTTTFTIAVGAIAERSNGGGGNNGGGNGGSSSKKYIFTTRFESNIWNWLMFILLFGFIWMWFFPR